MGCIVPYGLVEKRHSVTELACLRKAHALGKCVHCRGPSELPMARQIHKPFTIWMIPTDVRGQVGVREWAFPLPGMVHKHMDRALACWGDLLLCSDLIPRQQEFPHLASSSLAALAGVSPPESLASAKGPQPCAVCWRM